MILDIFISLAEQFPLPHLLGFCTLDETALFLEKSDIDPAPRDIYHMEYQGKIIPPWNEKLSD